MRARVHPVLVTGEGKKKKKVPSILKTKLSRAIQRDWNFPNTEVDFRKPSPKIKCRAFIVQSDLGRPAQISTYQSAELTPETGARFEHADLQPGTYVLQAASPGSPQPRQRACKAIRPGSGQGQPAWRNCRRLAGQRTFPSASCCFLMQHKADAGVLQDRSMRTRHYWKSQCEILPSVCIR